MSENNSQNDDKDNGEPSLRDALSAGFDDESGAAGGAQSDKTPAAGSSPAAGASPAAAPATPAAPAPGYLDGAAPKQPPGNVPPSQHAAPEVKPGVGGQPPAPSTVRAPTSWRPEVREKFNSLPPEVQAEVIRREREVTRVMAENAEARRTADAYTRTAAPYQHLIALEGGDTVKAFGDYLKTVTLLRSGTQVEKASALASAAIRYGVDVNYLDVALTKQLGGNPQQLPQNVNTALPQQPMHDPRLDGLLASMEQRRQQEDQQIESAATNDIETFAADPKNEFLADVRMDMADMLDMAAKRGRVMPLAEAYQRACSMHPEISKVLEQRRLAENMAGQQQVVNGKRRAAVSISSSSSRSGGNSDKPMSVREALESSIDQLGVG